MEVVLRLGRNEETVIKATTIGRDSNLSIVFVFITKGWITVRF